MKILWFMKNQYLRGNCLKGGPAQFGDLRGGVEGWQKRGGGVFEEGLMPSMHTMLLPAIILATFGKNQHGKPDMLVKIK